MAGRTGPGEGRRGGGGARSGGDPSRSTGAWPGRASERPQPVGGGAGQLCVKRGPGGAIRDAAREGGGGSSTAGGGGLRKARPAWMDAADKTMEKAGRVASGTAESVGAADGLGAAMAGNKIPVPDVLAAILDASLPSFGALGGAQG